MVAPPEEEESLGALVAQATNHISTLVRSEIELAKAELKFDARRVGMAAGLFASFALAYGLVAAGLWQWLAFLIVTVFYLLVAGALAFVGMRRLRGLTAMKRTTRTLKSLRGGPEAGPDGHHPELAMSERTSSP